MTRSTVAGSEKHTNPNPRGLPVFRSFMSSTDATAPYCWKWNMRLSSVVCQLSPPTKIFPWSRFELGSSCCCGCCGCDAPANVRGG
jgi:hypothetical protein